MEATFKKITESRLKDHFPAGIERYQPVGGGSINATYCLSAGSRKIFCKINSASKFPQLFSKEKEGLEAIGQQRLIRVPSVFDVLEVDGVQILLMEWISEGERTDEFWKTFGMQLAWLHQISNNEFGWEDDNYMGSVSQSNQRTASWPAFFEGQRLRPLVKQCLTLNLLTAVHGRAFESFYKKLPSLFNDTEKPALVHGDLWSGNFMCDEMNKPVLIDPAVYYGHPAVDLGMSMLFGGFSTSFYEAYRYHATLPANEEQWQVCNLYPLLIHLLLFGRSYLPRIENTLQQFA